MELKVIAKIENGFVSKFGIPRQSGLCSAVSTIVFEPEFRNPEALRGIEGYSHLWVIWQFSEAHTDSFSPTVRPPRLGGNKRVGVFATRSPFRPNSLGLTCVKLEGIEHTHDRGDVLLVSGADMMNGTPIFDIKPYIAYADSRPDAVSGFADDYKDFALEVEIPESLSAKVSPDDIAPLREILQNDPRPSYQHDPERVYYFEYKDYAIGFKADGERLTVTKIDIGCEQNDKEYAPAFDRFADADNADRRVYLDKLRALRAGFERAERTCTRDNGKSFTLPALPRKYRSFPA